MDFILWSLVVLVNICAAFQIRLGYYWLFILFCLFDICLGIFILLNFTFKHVLIEIIKSNKLEPLQKSSQFNTSDSNNSNNNNKLTEIFKTSSSIETINSSLISNNNYEQLLLDHNCSSAASSIIISNNHQLDQQDRDELEIEIKEEYRENDFPI